MDRPRVSAVDGSAWRDEAWDAAFTVDAPRTGRSAHRVALGQEARADLEQAAPDSATSSAVPDPANRPVGAGVPGRRTIEIEDRGADRAPFRSYQSRRRPSQARHRRADFRPDRAAMWAVVLGVLLALVAVASAHGALSTHVGRANTRAATSILHGGRANTRAATSILHGGRANTRAATSILHGGTANPRAATANALADRANALADRGGKLHLRAS